MRHRHEVAFLGRVGVVLLALRRGRLAVGVELDGGGGHCKLHRRDVHQIAPDDHLVAVAFDRVDGVAGRVATGWNGADAGHEFGLAIKGLELACGDIRIQRSHRALEEALGIGRGLVHVLLRQPEAAFAHVGAHDGIRKHHLAVGHQATDMVRVHVGDVDLVHLLGLVARSLEVAHQLAQRGAKEARRAGIDQHQLAAGVDEVAVDRSLDRRLEVGLGEQAFDACGRQPGEQLVHRQRDGAVGQRGDLEAAQRHAVPAGGLALGDRGFSLGQRGEGQQRGGNQAECGVVDRLGHVGLLLLLGAATLSQTAPRCRRPPFVPQAGLSTRSSHCCRCCTSSMHTECSIG